MRNASIIYIVSLLFAYFEYVGGDFDAEMAKMPVDPKPWSGGCPDVRTVTF